MQGLFMFYRSLKQLGFLVYSGAGEHSAPRRLSGRPQTELCRITQITIDSSTSIIHHFLFLWALIVVMSSAYPQCILPILVEAQGVSVKDGVVRVPSSGGSLRK